MSSGAPEPTTPVVMTVSDRKWLVGSIIGTGGAIATLLLALTGLIVQQNANVNARIDDVHRRIDDVQAEVRGFRAEVQSEIRELRAEVQSQIRELRAEVQSEIRELRAETRELRVTVIDALKAEPAD